MSKKSHKNGAGEGSIRKRTNGRWEARITTGYNPQTGKQVQKSIYGKTREEVARKLTAIRSSLDEGTYVEPSKMRTGEWVQKWMNDYAKLVLKDSTFETYMFLIKTHILPGIGDIPLDKLKTGELQQFYNDRYRKGKVIKHGDKITFEPLSVSTVKHIHNVVHRALNQAVREGLIRTNPDDACYMPKEERPKVSTLPLDGISELLEEAAKGKHYLLLYLDLCTGLRRGEILGLKWGDIDFETGLLTVKRQLTRIDGELQFSSLKTQNSSRSIKIPDSALGLLKQYQIAQEGQKEQMDNMWEDNDLVFCNEKGGPLDPSGIYHYFKRLFKRANAEGNRFHDIRHTFATIALQTGVDVKTIQESLGHYSAAFTLQVYGHVTKEMQKTAADKIDTFLSDKAQKDD